MIRETSTTNIAKEEADESGQKCTIKYYLQKL